MKKINFLILTSLTTLLMAPVALAVLPKNSPKTITNILISQDLSSEEIKQKAEAITVKIESDDTAVSGVIIGKESNTYTVLTNAHVINSQATHKIITIDGTSHEAKVIKEGNSLEGNDLAILTFNSPNNYQVGTLAIDPDLKENTRVYSVGFPEETNQFYFTQGTFKLQAPKPFLGGYQIGYDIDVKSGMSGGALLNEKGELIGINGLRKDPILDEAYNYLDGSQPYEEQIENYRKLSFAVPIETLMEVDPDLALIPDEWKTGLNIAENVDNIARQITVRIDNEDQVIGSGAIIGKDGDTYYVFTACHVVSDDDCQSGEVKDNYRLVTPDGEKYPLTKNDIILPEGLDAAIIKFESEKEYKVANIGKYNMSVQQKHLVFVSGFPHELNGVRKFTAGYQRNLDAGLGSAIESHGKKIEVRVDISGYELSYTNLSKQGMSGGPVLDIHGNVIGINTGQDDQEISKTVVHQLGYAYGVPASRLLAFADKKQVNLNLFTIIDKMPVPLKDQDLKMAKQYPKFFIEKPPENSDENAWLNYGNELLRVRRYKEAIAALNKAIEINEEFPEAHYALGLVYGNQAYHTDNDSLQIKAIAAFEKAISLSSYFSTWVLTPQAWYRKSMSLQNLGKHEEALVAIDEAIKIIDDDAKFHRERGFILEDLERYVEAKEAYDESLKISPLPLAYFSKCLLLLFEIKEPKAAIDDCSKAIKLGFIEAYSYRGIAHFALGNEQAALDDHNQAIALAPNSSILYMNRASMYRSMEEYELAIADINKAIEVDRENRDLAGLYFMLAIVYQTMGDYQQGILNYTKALELDPSDHTIYSLRGQLHNLNGQYDLAIQDMTKAIELQPDNADYYNYRGVYKSSLGDNQGAFKDYNRAIELDRNNALAYWKRASLYTDQFQDDKKAMEDLDRAIEINPKFGMAYKSRGFLRKRLSDLPGALEDYNRVIALIEDPDPALHFLYVGTPPEEIESWLPHQLKQKPSNNYDSDYQQRGDVRLELKDYEGALEDYNEAIRRNPNEGQNYVSRGDYYTQTKQPEKAQADYNKAIEAYSETIKTDPKNPNISFVYSSRASVYKKLKNNQAAIADYTQAIALTTYDRKLFSLLYLLRGNLYLDIKEHKLAIQDFSTFIKLQPENNQGYSYRCMVYTDLKDYNQAMKDCNQALAIAPNNPEVYLSSAALNGGLKNYSAAIKDANKIIELAPAFPVGYWVRGAMYWAQNNPTKALSDCELALSKNDQFAPAISCIAYIKYEQGDKQKAIELWQKALTIQDDLADTKLALAVALYHQGQPEKALSLAKEAINIDERFKDINHLEDNFWGKQLIEDTKPLLNKVK